MPRLNGFDASITLLEKGRLTARGRWDMVSTLSVQLTSRLACNIERLNKHALNSIGWRLTLGCGAVRMSHDDNGYRMIPRGDRRYVGFSVRGTVYNTLRDDYRSHLRLVLDSLDPEGVMMSLHPEPPPVPSDKLWGLIMSDDESSFVRRINAGAAGAPRKRDCFSGDGPVVNPAVLSDRSPVGLSRDGGGVVLFEDDPRAVTCDVFGLRTWL